jgi:hypothetical protein
VGISDNLLNNRWAYTNNPLFVSKNLQLSLNAQRQTNGQVFLDLNGNGHKDLNDLGINNFVIQANQSGRLYHTYHDGNLSFHMGDRSETLSMPNIPSYYTAATVSFNIAASSGTIPIIRFSIQPKCVVNDASVSLAPNAYFRLGYNNIFQLRIKNTGTLPTTGKIRLMLDPLLSITNAAPAPTSQNGDTLYWNFKSLPLLSELVYQINVKTALTPPGTLIHVPAEILSTSDSDPSNNLSIIKEPIVASYDPNEKTVSAAQVPLAQATEQELVYTVRFQNLGNTPTDFISIRDTLLQAIDPASIRV